MTRTSDDGKKETTKQGMDEKDRKGGASSHGDKNADPKHASQSGERGENLTNEDRKQGGEHSHGGK